VRVTTNDEMYTAGLLCKFEILFEANVSEGHDAGDVLFLGEEVDGVLDSLEGVGEGCALVRLGDVGGCLGGDGNETDVVLREDVVWDESLLETGVDGVDVGRNDWEIELLDLFSIISNGSL
jgi:hypothetical protein